MFVLIRTKKNNIIVLRMCAVPQNTGKWKQLDTATTQKHNKIQRGASLQGPLKTPNNTPTFCFNRRETRTQTISVEVLKY
jgi:hypothetical protein